MSPKRELSRSRCPRAKGHWAAAEEIEAWEQEQWHELGLFVEITVEMEMAMSVLIRRSPMMPNVISGKHCCLPLGAAVKSVAV